MQTVGLVMTATEKKLVRRTEVGRGRSLNDLDQLVDRAEPLGDAQGLLVEVWDLVDRAEREIWLWEDYLGEKSFALEKELHES